MTYITEIRRQQLNSKVSRSLPSNMEMVTMGIVVDANDPQQMGRLRVVCQRWGDDFDTDVENIPWALYASPFGGQIQAGTRGPSVDAVNGGTAYGMWAIPKVGAQVLVMCIDGDPNQRVYIGSIFNQFTPHTMPHGRFMYDKHPLLKDTFLPAGPYSSTEKFIEPLNTNLKKAFGQKKSPEWETRAADYQVAAVDVSVLDTTYSSVPDDKEVKAPSCTSTQGYQTDRQDPNAPSAHTKKNMSSMVYSITSPGFHAISMDDRIENCRIRMRTTAGHQIIMDDTNERIYISTATGENWVELDQCGNIDIFSSKRLNIRTKQGMNFTTDGDMRFHAAKGIHMYSGDEVRIQAIKDIHVKTDENIRVNAQSNIYIQASKELHEKSGGVMCVTSGGQMNFASGGNILMSASTDIHLNGPTATPASPPMEEKAKWTLRVPSHEPFARCCTKTDFSHEPEMSPTDPNVNRVERGQTITRGMFWRR